MEHRTECEYCGEDLVDLKFVEGKEYKSPLYQRRYFFCSHVHRKAYAPIFENQKYFEEDQIDS